MTDHPLVFYYTNWRGQTDLRRVRPVRVWHGKSGFHAQPQWFLAAYDLDRRAQRDFALADAAFDVPAAEIAALPPLPSPPLPRPHTIAYAVLAALADVRGSSDPGYHYLDCRTIARMATRPHGYVVPEPEARRAARRLARDGFVTLQQLFTEEGMVAGSGYGITDTGLARLRAARDADAPEATP